MAGEGRNLQRVRFAVEAHNGMPPLEDEDGEEELQVIESDDSMNPRSYNLPSGFWPPLKPDSSKGSRSSSATSVPGSFIQGRQRKTKATDSFNPNILAAQAPEDLRRMESIAEDSRISLEHISVSQTLGIGVSPQLRQRSRKIMDSRRITSPITRHRDVVWQEDPSRILKYRASILHQHGWVPFLIWRNVKATVFGNPYLYAQMLLMVGWVVLIHLTGLGAEKRDIQAFVRIFSTAYIGAVFNVGTVVVFILGLFVTLVINRWWSMRVVYAKLASNTVDVTTIITNCIRNPESRKDIRAKRARTELVRFLNLGHLLILTQADGQSRHFYRSELVRSMYERTIGRCVSCLTRGGESNSGTPGEARQSGTWQKAVRDISFQDLHAEGLVNIDEWHHIVDSENRGMPRYLLAYHWAEALLHELQANRWIYNSNQSFPAMLSKLSAIVDAGGQIFTYINSQLPYPYVHLVSMVVHSYLWVLATYVGALLYSGFNEAPGFVTLDINMEVSPDMTAQDLLASLINPPDGGGSTVTGVMVAPHESLQGAVFTTFFLYFFLVLAIATFQGLLDMHTLLDNPFGRHCAKFPLRAQITELMNTCRSLLQTGDTVPECFQDIFFGDMATVKEDPLSPKGESTATSAAGTSFSLDRRTKSVDFTSPRGRYITRPKSPKQKGSGKATDTKLSKLSLGKLGMLSLGKPAVPLTSQGVGPARAKSMEEELRPPDILSPVEEMGDRTSHSLRGTTTEKVSSASVPASLTGSPSQSSNLEDSSPFSDETNPVKEVPACDQPSPKE